MRLRSSFRPNVIFTLHTHIANQITHCISYSQVHHCDEQESTICRMWLTRIAGRCQASQMWCQSHVCGTIKSVLHTQHDQLADRHLRVKHAHAWNAARHLHIAEEERTTMSALKGLRACVRVREREREQQGERGRQGERECVHGCA